MVRRVGTTGYQVRPQAAERFVVTETIDDGEASSLRVVAEFFNQRDADGYVAWKRGEL